MMSNKANYYFSQDSKIKTGGETLKKNDNDGGDFDEK